MNKLIMGDVLPPKRQTVVERLKRRFDLYRRHQNACLPRYEQAEHGLYDAQRQETLLLKQRFLESKAKKAKNNKSDHHRAYKESVTDSSKNQAHSKPLKRPAEDSVPNPTTECTNSEDAEKPSKLLRTDISTDKLPDLQTQQAQKSHQQSNLPSFSVQIVQQFSKTSHSQQPQTIQTNVTVQALTSPISQPTNIPSQESVPNSNDNQQINGQTVNVECKQEKDCGQSDLCQFKGAQNSSSDRLSDTFPSLGFTDDSGDDVIHPDLLKDLIDDVFTNSADIMKDFNFDDSVGSIKDQGDATKDIIDDLVKESSPMQLRAFSTDNLSFVNTVNTQQQRNDLFKSMPSGNETPLTSMVTSTPTSTTTTTNFYSSPTQRLQYNGSSLSVPNGLNIDFKLTEPSPAALTLKQMAEQHQNMQQKQQQMVTSPLANRPSPFNQDTFNSHMSQMRPLNNYMPGTNSVMTSSPKPSNTTMFNAFDRQMSNTSNFANNETLNNVPMNPSNMFEADIRSRPSNLSEVERTKQSSCHNMQPQKPPAYVPPRLPTNFSENPHLRLQNTGISQQRPINRQFQNNIQLSQSQQMHTTQGHHSNQQIHQNSHDVKQSQHHLIHPPQTNPYVSFPSQQPTNNTTFHVSMSQNISYNAQFTPNQAISRPPPEYKAHHSNLNNDNVNLIEQLNTPSHALFNHAAKNKFVRHPKPANVTITPDGSAISSSRNWRHAINEQKQNNQYQVGFQDNYGNFARNEQHSIQQPQMFNQYRLPSNQMSINRMIRPNILPNNNIIMQQHQRVNAPQRLKNPPEMEQQQSITIRNNSLSTLPSSYSNHQDMSRSDGSQINLDFLDNIESSASDLLNFDQVMQSSGTHFPLLDDMEILGK